jgi:hypothetical protein
LQVLQQVHQRPERRLERQEQVLRQVRFAP